MFSPNHSPNHICRVSQRPCERVARGRTNSLNLKPVASAAGLVRKAQTPAWRVENSFGIGNDVELAQVAVQNYESFYV